MASRLSGVLGNAGCQEPVNATDWETQIEVFPGRSPGVLVMMERSQEQERQAGQDSLALTRRGTMAKGPSLGAGGIRGVTRASLEGPWASPHWPPHRSARGGQNYDPADRREPFPRQVPLMGSATGSLFAPSTTMQMTAVMGYRRAGSEPGQTGHHKLFKIHATEQGKGRKAESD